MSTWKIEQTGNLPKFTKPVLLEGLPGIGNVGKVAVDFLVDELEAKKILSLSSSTFPHSVFVNEDNLVELPTIEMYHKKMKGKDLLFLVGDVQPMEEVSCYDFCTEVLKLFRSYGGNEIITVGGIGLQDIPKQPKVYCTGNSSPYVKNFRKGTVLEADLYGVVGPIVGVSGLLVGMAKESNIKAICLLAETFGHPMYLGVKGAREILKIITKKLHLQVDLKELDKEITEIEKGNLTKAGELAKQQQLTKLKKGMGKDVNYIG
jgi:uncharacterized protein